ncbi:MAG: hypothetical protein Q8M26_12955 [Pseudolabrys sp.]|nr:hypothetical protein [Pseudolabrys sp.]
MSKVVQGTCCICGRIGKLSFEHIPPAAAFNDRRIFEADINALLAGKWSPGERVEEGKYKQRGAGRHSLCEKCNSDTGSWYGATYVDVARQAMILLHASQGSISLAYPYRMYPLRFLKQIAVMFCSACGPDFQKGNADLVRFILNQDERSIPNRLRFYIYLHHPKESKCIRQVGLTSMLVGRKQHFFSEIAFPPFGLIMSIDHPPVHDKLCEITHLKEFSYKAWDIGLHPIPKTPS